MLGNQIHRLTGPLGIAALLLAVMAVGGIILLFRRHEHRLLAEAEQAYPGRLEGRPIPIAPFREGRHISEAVSAHNAIGARSDTRSPEPDEVEETSRP
jgi:hypothetical protein